jgi:hypothetical protein
MTREARIDRGLGRDARTTDGNSHKGKQNLRGH